MALIFEVQTMIWEGQVMKNKQLKNDGELIIHFSRQNKS